MMRTLLRLAGLSLCLLPFACAATRAAESGAAARFDVLRYDARVEPDIAGKSVAGRVLISFVSHAAGLSEVEFDCGAGLAVDSVKEGARPLKFERRGERLIVALSRPARAGESRAVEVVYHGTPRRGIRFYPDRGQVYTVFSTSQWMPCVDAPEDRAALRMTLVLPARLASVANGRLASRRATPDGRVAYEWRQDVPVPTYVFGFAAGRFREVNGAAGRRGRPRLRYLAEGYADEELRRAFEDTADMFEFFEQRSGLRYAGAVYTQVLAQGSIDQEMSGFTVMHEGYGREVLADAREVWLGAHELAHQWWGIAVTCRDWTHFWLNEGTASFMAAAYEERRFGRARYERRIAEYRASYEKVRDAGKDRSLVFPDWNRPTAEDRTLVYDKGAYVLHLLREEMGERAFWAGLRAYTRGHAGRSVTTEEFQRSMQRASGKDLSEFFDKWVYLRRR